MLRFTCGERKFPQYYFHDFRVRLGFSHLSEHKFRHKFADSLNPLCSCSLETESTLYFFLSCQNYATLHRALMTDLKNINNAIMSLNESDLLHVILYRDKNFDNMNISIRNYQVYQRHWKIWSTSLLTIIKTILINSSIPFLIFFQEVCCITTMIFALMSYNFHLIV